MSTATALVPVNLEQYPVLAEASTVVENIRLNLGGEQVTPQDLNRIKVPGSGSTVWTVQGEDGKEVGVSSLEGIIVHIVHPERAYWDPNDDMGSKPPLCRSSDCVTGIGTPGGTCAECPFNQFGSAIKNGKPAAGKACGEYKFIFFLRAGQMLPDVIKIPVMSLRAMLKYQLGLNAPYFGVITSLALVKEKSKGGSEYARISPTKTGVLGKEATEGIRAYANALSSVFKVAATTVASRDDDDDDDEGTVF